MMRLGLLGTMLLAVSAFAEPEVGSFYEVSTHGSSTSLKAGETRSFKTDSPSITPLATLPYPYIQGCYIQHIFKLTVRDGAGSVLATDWQINAVQSRI